MQASTTEFDSDKVLLRTLMNNFGSILVFVFYADWNESSRQFLANLNNSIPIFGGFDNVKYFSLAAEKCPETFKKFAVEKTPTVILTQTDKKVLQRLEGNDVGAVFDSLEKLSGQYKTQFEKDVAIWHPKVKALVESCPFIVFIKGTPENPKCGFTTTILQIFKKHQIEYTYYDIIEDEQMRNWVRHYSGWPTYPAVFVNGKAIGGLDKVKELVEKGEFDKMVPASCKHTDPKQRYEAYIGEHETVVFVDGFTFENQDSQKKVEEGRKKYGEGLAVYNVAIDKNIRAYIGEQLNLKLPFIVHKKAVVE